MGNRIRKVKHYGNYYFFLFKATKLEEHKRKYERKREDKEIKEKQERIKKAQEEHRKVRD